MVSRPLHHFESLIQCCVIPATYRARRAPVRIPAFVMCPCLRHSVALDFLASKPRDHRYQHHSPPINKLDSFKLQDKMSASLAPECNEVKEYEEKFPAVAT